MSLEPLNAKKQDGSKCGKCGLSGELEFCEGIGLELCADCFVIFEAEGEEGLNEALGI